MSKAAIKPGLIPYLHRYLEQKTGEYATLSERWLNGADICRYPPATWPPDRCLLARLPAELLFLICERLYQADLFHLALTCRELACIPTSLLYRRDITDFDCLALRWACTFGVVQTLHRTLDFGAPADHVFDLRSHVRCSWVIGSAGGICGTPLKTAIAANEPEMVQQLLAHGVNVNAARVRAGDKYGLRYGLRYDLLLPINFAIGTPDMPLPQCQLGNPQIVRILLDAGADPNQRSIPSHHVPPDRFSSRPGLPDSYYYFMRGRGMSDVAPLLMAMRATVPVETVKVLLERGADPTLGFDAGRYRFPEQRSSLEVVLTYSLYPAIHDIFPLDLDKIQLLLRYGP